MKLLFQILFLLLTWFTSQVNATPVYAKVELPSYELSFSKTENVKEYSITKIGDVDFNTNGNITVTKEELEIGCDTLNANTYNQNIICYGNWTPSTSYTISPFNLVMFTNFSNLSAIDGATQTFKGTVKIVPAVYLKYSKDKETNYKIEKGISYTIDGLTLISGVGTVLNGGFKALNWGRKAWIIYNTSVATTNLIINVSDLPNDPDFQGAYQAYTAITIAGGLGELSYNGIKKFSNCVRTTKNIASNVSQVTKQQYLELIYKLDAVYAKIQNGTLILNEKALIAYKKLKAYVDRLKQNWQKLFKEPLPSNILQGAGKVLVNSWNEAVTAVDNLILPKTSQLNNLIPNAKIGYRGSLSTGTKYSTGGPFDPTDWDVDAFIVSDNLAAQIGGGGFRNGRNIPSVANIADELETSFKNISGYRTELNKPFTFRVFTEAEFNSIVKPNGYKLFQ